MDTRGEFACIPYLGDDLPGAHLVALSLSDGGVVLVYRDEVMWVFYNQDEACLCRPFCENNGTLAYSLDRGAFGSGKVDPIMAFVDLELIGDHTLDRREEGLAGIGSSHVKDIVAFLIGYL